MDETSKQYLSRNHRELPPMGSLDRVPEDGSGIPCEPATLWRRRGRAAAGKPEKLIPKPGQLFAEPFQDAAAGKVDGVFSDSQFHRDFPCRAIHRDMFPTRTPSCLRKRIPHQPKRRPSDVAAVFVVGQQYGRIALRHIGKPHQSWLGHPVCAPKMVAALVQRHRPEPAAKAAWAVFAQPLCPIEQYDKHFLDKVVHCVRFHSRFSNPVVDQRSVKANEPAPGLRIVGGTKTDQKAELGGQHRQWSSARATGPFGKPSDARIVARLRVVAKTTGRQLEPAGPRLSGSTTVRSAGLP